MIFNELVMHAWIDNRRSIRLTRALEKVQKWSIFTHLAEQSYQYQKKNEEMGPFLSYLYIHISRVSPFDQKDFPKISNCQRPLRYCI